LVSFYAVADLVLAAFATGFRGALEVVDDNARGCDQLKQQAGERVMGSHRIWFALTTLTDNGGSG
jgi:hypothetical protein